MRRLKQEHREQGKIAPQLTRHRHKSGESQAKWLLAKLEERPDIYLRELQATAQIELGWQVPVGRVDQSIPLATEKLGPLCGQVRDLFTDTKCRNYIAHCGYRNT